MKVQSEASDQQACERRSADAKRSINEGFAGVRKVWDPSSYYRGQWDGRSPVPVKQKDIVLAHAVPQISWMVSVAIRGRVPTFTMMSCMARARAVIAPDRIDARQG